MEKLLLGALLALEELNIIHHENIQVTVPAFKGFLPVIPHRIDVVVGELFAGHVFDAQVRVQLLGIVTDGVHEVGFPQAGIPPHEERVIGAGRFLRHRNRGRGRKFVRIRHHVGIKGVSGVEGIVLGRVVGRFLPGPQRGPGRGCGLRGDRIVGLIGVARGPAGGGDGEHIPVVQL